uniref:Uncharacterized protein n=1 Tax=Setaria digitata TaxID=48799 RepID=A0A915PLA0_9BILA
MHQKKPEKDTCYRKMTNELTDLVIATPHWSFRTVIDVVRRPVSRDTQCPSFECPTT